MTGSRFRTGIALLAALAVAYSAGIITGALGTRPGDRAERDTLRVAGEYVGRNPRGAVPGHGEHAPRAADRSLLAHTHDRWSAYYTPSEFTAFRQSLEGRYGGVGLRLRDSAAGPVVSEVVGRSPALRAGVRRGDVVVEVNRASVSDESASDVADLLRGPVGRGVSVTVRRDGRHRVLPMTRSPLDVADLRLERLPDGVVRLQVSAFTRGVGDRVDEILDDHRRSAVNGIVLDLRGNPGGLVEEAVDVASVFLDGGPVATYERRGRPDRTLRADEGGDTTVPLVVLVDEGTASAAELLSASLQDRSRAVVVGSHTFGKGVVQEPKRLSDGSGLTLTLGRYLTPSGQGVGATGVQPDVVVPAGTPATVGERRAVHVLAGLTAAMTSNGQG